MVNGLPVVAVAGAVMLSVLAAAGLTVVELGWALTNIGAVNRSRIVSALSSARLVKVAMPPETVTVVVPKSGPVPTPARSEAVTWVVLSPVKRLPYWSST